MRCKHLFLIIIIATLAYSPVFLRETPTSWDPYFFLDSVCNNSPLLNQPIGTKIVFGLLPCNIMAIQVLFLGLMIVSCIFIAKWGMLYNPKWGWFAGIAVFATPIWLLEFWKIENDAIAYTLIFIGAYYFYKGLKNKTTKEKLAGIGLVLLAFTIWEGAALWLIAFSLSWIWIAIPTLAVLAFNFKNFAGKIAPVSGAMESVPGFGMLYQAFLLTAIMFVPKITALLPATILFAIIAGINLKLAIHATPLLAIAATTQVAQSKTILMKLLPFAGIAIVILFTSSMVLNLPPTSQELMASQLAVEEAKGSIICNDWHTGHLINFLGGEPLAKGGIEQCRGCVDCIVLSYREFDCPILNDVNGEMDLKVYKC